MWLKLTRPQPHNIKLPGKKRNRNTVGIYVLKKPTMPTLSQQNLLVSEPLGDCSTIVDVAEEEEEEEEEKVSNELVTPSEFFASLWL